MLELSARLLALLGDVRLGDEVLPGQRLVAASTELGIRWTFERNGQRLHVELSQARVGARYAARTSRLLIAYRLPPSQRQDAAHASAALALCQQLAPIIAQHEDAVLEPRAASIDERLDTLRTLRAAGVHTFAVVQPMLPGDVHALADAIAASCDAASLDVLRGEEGATADFDDTRYTFSRDARWQSERLDALRDALLARGVALFDDELPSD